MRSVRLIATTLFALAQAKLKVLSPKVLADQFPSKTIYSDPCLDAEIHASYANFGSIPYG